jgi:hypothetical protein
MQSTRKYHLTSTDDASYVRVHKMRVSTTSKDRNAYLSAKLSDFLTYGPAFLTGDELRDRRNELLLNITDFSR